MNDSQRGLLLALAAYGIWGCFALFFHLVKHIPAVEVLGHRVLWSLIFVAIVLSATRQWKKVRYAFNDRRLLLLLAGSSCMIAINWVLYIWAVGAGRAVEASLGYFINPLVAVALAVIFLKETLFGFQKIAIGLALAGVGYKLISVGELPWISLTLATTFAFYGLIRKQTQVDAVSGLFIETLILVPAALAYLSYLLLAGTGSSLSSYDWGLLILSGIITALPLIAFSAAAKHLSLTVLGFMIYLAPSLQLLSAVLILGEPFNQDDWVTFALIWAGLIVFSGGAALKHQRSRTKHS
ncbi:EamA family transporter RarD [Neptunomonas sp. XY-337]|uniref:EamA family transporter RarD n=1 Tax=Neptunomonas sp. XY-337 TaxID=2561897 RepID=UPI0010AAC0A6|nr:EamA family transporter RarD [Neptunomonas sp. XY-337]